MPKIIYFDPFNGVSGDMTLGALIDLGVPLDFLRSELARLNLGGYELGAQKLERQGLSGVNFKVEVRSDHEHRHGAEEEHHHHHHHDHHHGMGFSQIRRMIENSALDEWVQQKAVAVFRRLGEAEAKVHQSTLEKVHFHEVGAVDSIVDIVGACLGFRYLEVEAFYSAPLVLGSGTVTFSHGTWPVPAPATAELVRDFPVLLGGYPYEMTTPTGAAIVTTLARPGSPPAALFERWGLGAGDREMSEAPNMLRLGLGRVHQQAAADRLSQAAGPYLEEEVLLLEANIDNMEGELFGHFLDLALAAGALDVYFVPVQMKKNRPGTLLSLLCRPEDRNTMAELILRETTTLGLRWSAWNRSVLEREVREVETPLGKVHIKIGRLSGKVTHAAPEYDDLARLASQTGLPLKTVRRKVVEHLAQLKLYE